MQERCRSIANALELYLCCTKPSIGTKLHLSCTKPSITMELRLSCAHPLLWWVISLTLPVLGLHAMAVIENVTLPHTPWHLIYYPWNKMTVISQGVTSKHFVEYKHLHSQIGYLVFMSSHQRNIYSQSLIANTFFYIPFWVLWWHCTCWWPNTCKYYNDQV